MYEHIVNYNVSVKEHDDKVIFLRKLVRGGADHSYGIQVADMAGLPSIVIERAKEILSNLENHSLDLTDSNGTLEEGAKKKKAAVKKSGQRDGEAGADSANVAVSDTARSQHRTANRQVGSL